MTTVLVTGANRGLGLEFARQYTADGAAVLACCRTPAKAEVLNSLGKAVRILELDIGDPASVARLADTLNGVPIDILINNAGVYGPAPQNAGDCDYDGFIETFRINTAGPLLLSQALRPNLLRGHDKKLAVITSKMGSISDSSGGAIAYRASKAALNMVMDSIAKEWAVDGIAVGILHPGWVQTDMGGAGALISPPESVKGLKARIAELGPHNSGRYIDYAGKPIGW